MNSRNFDGYMMLALSLVIITLSFCLTYTFVFIYVVLIAIKEKCDDLSVNCVVVLGKKLINNEPDKDYILRLNRAIAIVENKRDAHIYLLGGVTGESIVSESKAGRLYLENNKITAKHIYIEETSKDTLDNMKHLKDDVLSADKDIILISNRYHLARAGVMAQGFGFNVQRCAAEDSYSINTNVIAMFGEAFFLHWYLSGRVYAKITGNQRMLARIQ